MRAAFRDGIAGLVDILASVEDAGTQVADRSHALADLSTMVGALILARATAGAAISDEFLAAARTQMLTTAQNPATRQRGGA